MNVAEELNPYDAQEEELNAYLDGELEPGERERLERRLATDASLREKLKKTQQSWDALDLLPKARADETFAGATLEMTVAMANDETVQAPKSILPPERRSWLKLGGGALFAACLGFVLVRAGHNNVERKLLRDLPVVERMEPLSNTPSIDFLRKLEEKHLFVSDEPHVP